MVSTKRNPWSGQKMLTKGFKYYTNIDIDERERERPANLALTNIQALQQLLDLKMFPVKYTPLV